MGRLGGRQKGTKNKRTVDLEKKLKKLGCDPIQAMVYIIQNKDMVTGAPVKFQRIIGKGENQQVVDMDAYDEELRFQCAKELAQYVAPKRKAIEHGGMDGAPGIRFEVICAPDDNVPNGAVVLPPPPVAPQLTGKVIDVEATLRCAVCQDPKHYTKDCPKLEAGG